MKLFPSISNRPRQILVLLLLVAAGCLAGCSGEDYSSYTSTSDYTGGYAGGGGSFYYGVGVYQPWGYAGNPYYGYGHW